MEGQDQPCWAWIPGVGVVVVAAAAAAVVASAYGGGVVAAVGHIPEEAVDAEEGPPEAPYCLVLEMT